MTLGKLRIIINVEKCHAPVISTPNTLELIKDTIVLIQIAKLSAEMIMYGDGLDRPSLHIDIPNLKRQVVSGKDVSSIVAKLDIRNTRDYLREK